MAHPGCTAVPDGAGPHPGVVVVHDAFGVSADTRRVCGVLAEHGYLAHAPSLYQRGRCLRQVFRSFLDDAGPTYQRLQQERAALAARGDCTGVVGVMGFCMGGRFALVASGAGTFDAASVSYPVLPAGRQEPEALDRMLSDPCPVIGSFGGRDSVVPVEEVDKLRRGLARHHVPHEVTVYPEATHSFLSAMTGPLGVLFRVQGMRPDREAAADAWRRVLAFFDEHLHPPGSQPGSTR